MKWTGNKFHNEYGCISGKVVEIGEDEWLAFCPADEYMGDYVTRQDAINAVEHSFHDPKRMPYPISYLL